jgi:hypothetical protein
VQFTIGKRAPEIGRAVWVVINGCGDGFARKGMENGWIAQTKHDEVNGLLALPYGFNEGETQILLGLVGIKARGLRRDG